MVAGAERAFFITADGDSVVQRRQRGDRRIQRAVACANQTPRYAAPMQIQFNPLAAGAIAQAVAEVKQRCVRLQIRGLEQAPDLRVADFAAFRIGLALNHLREFHLQPARQHQAVVVFQ